MELLLVLLAAPLLWFLLSPARALARVRHHPFFGAGLLGALLVAGWLGLSALKSPAPADYAPGDTQLRAMLE